MPFISPPYSPHGHPSKKQRHSYISILYSASPQCANTKGPGKRVETHLRTQTIHGMPIIILFISHPWLCTLRIQLPTQPEVTRQTQSPPLSSSSGVFRSIGPWSALSCFGLYPIFSCRCGLLQGWHSFTPLLFRATPPAYQLNHQRPSYLIGRMFFSRLVLPCERGLSVSSSEYPQFGIK